MAVTASEALVERIARRSFLSLWSEPNPLARPGKELCDLLVVCDPDVILFSVKEVKLERGGTREVDANRWRRRAIEKSVQQLHGAERQLGFMNRVIKADGSAGLALPAHDRRRLHRLAVALGANGTLPIVNADSDNAFVYIVDELGLDRVLGELDTVTDLVEYLRAIEELSLKSKVIMASNASDLLAVYLHRGRAFPAAPDLLFVEPGSWESLTVKPEWGRRKDAERESYVWDALIETLIEGTGVAGSVGAQGLDEREAVLRVLARESRFERRVLARQFNDFMAQAAAMKIRARQVPSPSGVVYVFLAAGHGEPRDLRVTELQFRCLVARGQHPDATTVIGLATERYQKNEGFSLDLARVTIERWTDEHERAMRKIQKECGYFVSPRLQHTTVDEYPA